VLGTIASFLQLNEVTQVSGAVLLQLSTLWLASYTTQRIGDKERQTTNAMPYPKHATSTDIQTTKDMYRGSQFLAGSMVYCWTSSDLTFMPLLAIQIAPSCMTLARKNMLSPMHHHCIYAWSLWLNLLGMLSVLWHDPAVYRDVMWSLLTYQFVQHLRVTNRQPKNLSWVVGPVGACAVVRACEYVSPFLVQLLPNLLCPRLYWLSLKLGGVTVAVLWENRHIMLPAWRHANPHLTGAIDRSVLDLVRLISRVCDLMFYGGILLSGAVILWSTDATT
jgi:hypothetical protein